MFDDLLHRRSRRKSLKALHISRFGRRKMEQVVDALDGPVSDGIVHPGSLRIFPGFPKNIAAKLPLCGFYNHLIVRVGIGNQGLRDDAICDSLKLNCITLFQQTGILGSFRRRQAIAENLMVSVRDVEPRMEAPARHCRCVPGDIEYNQCDHEKNSSNEHLRTSLHAMYS